MSHMAENIDNRTGKIQPKLDPSNDGTKHLEPVAVFMVFVFCLAIKAKKRHKPNTFFR